MSSSSPLRRLGREFYRIDTDDADVERRGRALLTVLLVLASSIFGVSLLAISIAPPDRVRPTLVVSVILVAVCSASGSLARRGRVDLGGLLCSGSLSLLIAAYQISVRSYTDFLWFMALSVVIASITVRPRLIWATAAVNIGLLAPIAAYVDEDPSEKLRVSSMLVSLVVPLTVFTYLSAGRTYTLFRGQAKAMRELEAAKAQLGEALVVAKLERHRAESANRTKSTFLANMSHELRTPLNAIIGYAELLREDAVDEQVAHDLGTIGTAGQHLLAIISDILDLSRVEAGKLAISPAPIELQSLTHELRDTIAPLLTKYGNTLRLEGDLASVQLTTDPLRHKQILLNLLTNAAKFTENGSITLRVSSLPGGPGDTPWIRFDVVDTGVGMDESTLRRVFDDFTQADDSSTRRHGGAGLGLSLSRRLAAHLGGTLTATSEPGVGSTFSLLLPTSIEVDHARK